MLPTAPQLSASPLRPLGPRIDSLDLLRGVAILGIFLMNTQSMLLPQNSYVNPASHGDFANRNFWAYVFTNIFADMKFISIFSFMFGAGIMLQGERVESRGMSAALIHYLRMIVLLGFGLFHAYVLWYGDILTTYACCGLLFYPLKKLPPTLLLGLGLVLILGEIPLSNAIVHDNTHFFPLQQIQEYHNRVAAGTNDYAEGVAYLGPIADEFHYRAVMSWDGQTYVFAIWTFWRCGGCILVGMALHRLRFFHGDWGTPAYVALAIFGTGTGWTLTSLGIGDNQNEWWNDTFLWATGLHYNYLGSLLASLGYMAVGVLVAQEAAHVHDTVSSSLLRKALVPIRAVGKTALSNYIFQSVVGTTLAYAHLFSPGFQLGFGWFGKVSRAGLLPIVLITWAMQLVLSPIWLRHFKQGPLEWLWHKLVYLGHPFPARPQESSLEAPAAEAPLSLSEPVKSV